MTTEKKILAIGLDTHLCDYPWLNGADCDSFLSSGFFVTAKRILEEAGFRIVRGQEVLQELMGGKVGADEVHLLQFEESITGKRLSDIGVARSLLVNLESPLVVTDLYLDLDKTSASFDFCLGLWSSFQERVLGPNMMSARFPSYPNADRLTISSGQSLFPETLDFQEKRMASMILSNKYWRPVGLKHFPRNLAKTLLVGSASHKRRQIRTQSLHDTRLRLISYFQNRQLVDVWGAGWDGRNLPFPLNFDRTLQKFTAEPLPFGGNEKLKVMSTYRFALVTENMRYPGYITEKIFDAFISGSVPVYWGAPDIENFVPTDCFIDGQKFESLSAIAEFMLSMSETQHRTFVEAGVDFLSSPAGYAHTFEAFGQEVAGLLLR